MINHIQYGMVHFVPCAFQQKKQSAPVLEQSLSAGKLSLQSKEHVSRDKTSPTKVEQSSRNKPGIVYVSCKPSNFTALKRCESMGKCVLPILSLSRFNDAFSCVRRLAHYQAYSWIALNIFQFSSSLLSDNSLVVCVL